MKENNNGGATVIHLNAVNYRPCGDFLHIEAEEAEMAGGLHLPQGARAIEFVPARVISAGPECKWVKDGENVLVAAQAIMKVKHNNQVAQFTKESSLITRL